MKKSKLKKFNAVAEQLKIPLKGNAKMRFYTASGLHVATGYKRVVIGDRGPYIEFNPQQVVRDNLHIPEQRHVYFTELRSNDESNVMVYDQRRTVKYADYKIGLYYVSPVDLYVGGSPTINQNTIRWKNSRCIKKKLNKLTCPSLLRTHKNVCLVQTNKNIGGLLL